MHICGWEYLATSNVIFDVETVIMSLIEFCRYMRKCLCKDFAISKVPYRYAGL